MITRCFGQKLPPIVLILLVGQVNAWGVDMKLQDRFAKFLCETSTVERMEPIMDIKTAIMPRGTSAPVPNEIAKMDKLWAEIQPQILSDLQRSGISRTAFQTLGKDPDRLYEFSVSVRRLASERCPKKFPEESIGVTDLTIQELTERLAKSP
jgi:hypothetical protein